MNKLKWKQKWCDDKSGYWYSAKVPFLNWEYIIDVYQEPEEYSASIFYSPNDNDSTPIISKTFRKKEGAMNACEKHLEKMSSKFRAWLSEN
jgi:hypothetical protein